MELKLERIEQKVGASTHLYPLDLQLVPRAVTVLLGATQAGKTTLMRVMAGLDKPTAGRVIADGADVTFFRSRPGNSPMIEMQNFLWHLMHKEIHHILVSQKVRTFDRIPGVQFKTVAFILAHDSSGAALSRHGMRTH